ncbi:hypothetical protein D3C84_1005950 [compost metagenome]
MQNRIRGVEAGYGSGATGLQRGVPAVEQRRDLAVIHILGLLGHRAIHVRRSLKRLDKRRGQQE